MTSSSDRLDRIETLLEQFITASVADRQASNERMTRLEQAMEDQRHESNERLTRVELVVESNNRFLEAFSTDLRRYTETLNNFATRIDGVIATTNQDRQDSNTRLSAIQRQVSAIAKHLGVS